MSIKKAWQYKKKGDNTYEHSKTGRKEMLNNLPKEINYDEIMAEIYFKQKIDKSLKQIKEGKVISHEKVKEKLSKWIK